MKSEAPWPGWPAIGRDELRTALAEAIARLEHEPDTPPVKILAELVVRHANLADDNLLKERPHLAWVDGPFPPEELTDVEYELWSEDCLTLGELSAERGSLTPTEDIREEMDA